MSKYLPQKKLILNPLQIAAIEANRTHKAKHINIEAGRGSGKSTLLGWYMKEGVRQMPRATGVLVGETFVQIKSRTLPSTKEGLEMFGLYEGIDYVVGKSGQSMGFELPFQAPNSWSNVIHFRNGFVWVMVSLDNPDSGRGLNSYIVIGDEAALLSYERLFNNVLTTNRAKKVEFEKCSLVNATIFTSSVALTKKGDWFTQREQLAKKKPNEYVFLKAPAHVNIENLKKGWIQEMREQAVSELIFNAEIKNIRPKGVAEGFYAQLKDHKHYYKHKYDINLLGGVTEKYIASCKYDTDLLKNQPIDFALDFGGRINTGIVSQYLKSLNQVNILNEFFVKNPHKLSDLVKKFIDYYQDHNCKEVNLYHDRSGYKAEANSKTTLAQDVENQLRAAGWKVMNKTPNSNNPAHMLKFRLINEILSEASHGLPHIRINQDNCPNLIISMENAGLNHKGDAFEKDKSSERSTVILQEHATHLSDCFDYLLWWKFSYLMDYNYHSSYIVTNL
ncbi:hypothetical protein ABMY20_15385 [Tenacibaculum sp. SSH1-16]|uniref:hypothetical protein n=1 Tax=Tenacibaculum sp. SSH1-16 TaxID=3136667 RepID=UPI0032C46641